MKFVIDPGAFVPTRGHEHDAGLDLKAVKGGWILPFSRKSFETGIHVEIPKDFVGMLTSKSGLMSKKGITSRGTIDCGYTGTIKAVLFNHSIIPRKIKRGQKITQLVIFPIILPWVCEADSLEDTDRGNGGFGSTGDY